MYINAREAITFIRSCNDVAVLKQILLEAKDRLIGEETVFPNPETLEDELKLELMAQAYRKYTLTELEEKLK